MSVVGIIGTIVFFAVVALALMAATEVIFSSSRRSSDKVRANTRKSAWLTSWLAKVTIRTKKPGASRQESRPRQGK